MKQHFHSLALCVGLVAGAAGALPAGATTYFHEDFESDVYPLDLPIPLDFGVIKHGRWSRVPPASRPGVVIEEDGSRVLQLRAVPGFARGSRAIGMLGVTNEDDSQTTEALRFHFRFKFTAPLGDSLYVQLLGSDGRSKAMITMNDAGILHASFGGEREPVGDVLESNRWYAVEILLPANPRTKSIYEVNLYDGATKIGHNKGVMARSMDEEGANYQSIDIQHKQLNESLLIDDLVVEALSAR